MIWDVCVSLSKSMMEFPKAEGNRHSDRLSRIPSMTLFASPRQTVAKPGCFVKETDLTLSRGTKYQGEVLRINELLT